MRNFFVLVLNTTVYILLLLFFTFFLQPLFQIWQRSVVSVCQTQTCDSVMTWAELSSMTDIYVSSDPDTREIVQCRTFTSQAGTQTESHQQHAMNNQVSMEEKKKEVKMLFFLDVNFQPQHQISPTFTTCHAQVLLHGILRPTTASGSTAGELRDTYHHSFVRSWQPERNLPVVLKRDKEHRPCYPRNCRKTASDTGIIVIVCATSASSSNCTKKF